MKALKIVATALGVTLAALVVIPLVVLAVLFVWLKLTDQVKVKVARSAITGLVTEGQASPQS